MTDQRRVELKVKKRLTEGTMTDKRRVELGHLNIKTKTC
jgi:hypothetical protein